LLAGNPGQAAWKNRRNLRKEIEINKKGTSINVKKEALQE